HTALVPVAWLCGLETVGEAMQDADIRRFVERAISEEIIPVLDLPADELREFADAVSGRFQNPYIRHQLLSIALNGMTKFRTRILPQLLTGEPDGRWPVRLTFALAALLAFYRAERNGERYPIQDDEQWVSLYASLWPRVGNDLTLRELVDAVLGDAEHWGEDLTLLPGLAGQVTANLEMILVQGMRQAVNGLE
ncbi:tagaturonate reductase, partial [Citrobacter freundii]